MNKVVLIGNLTRDPELKTTKNGITFCNFSLAVNRRNRDANGNQITDFLNVVAWRQLAELCGRYLTKGSKACVVGSIQTRSYQAQDGSKRIAVDIVADEVEFLGTRQQSAGVTQSQKAANTPNSGYTQAVSTAESQGFTQIQVDDDELPF